MSPAPATEKAPLRQFLEIPYDELEVRNLAIKTQRLDRVDGEKLKNCGKFSVFPKESRAFASVVGYPAGLPLSADAEYEAILNQSGKPEYYSNESKAQLLQLEEQK